MASASGNCVCGGNVSPILVRPVREQLEHDRIIRLLPARYRRRFDVGINPGIEQNAPVGAGLKAVYPDAVLYAGDKGHKVLGVAEVETVESVNHLEAMSQWASLGRLKVPFHLYVPASAIDVARRMAIDYQVLLTELWSYDNVGDQVRFTLIQRAAEPTPTMVSRGAGGRKPGGTPTAKSPASRLSAGGPARARVPAGTAQPPPARAAARAKPAARPAPKPPTKRTATRAVATRKAAPRKPAPRKAAPTPRKAQKRR
jgi:hypothetical protein